MLPFIGHRDVYQKLAAFQSRDSRGASLLFAGSDGIGKKSLAFYWIQSFLCRDLRNDGDLVFPCLKCASCVQIETKSSPELFFVEESLHGIPIQKIREAKAWASFTSFADKKFLVIDGAHALQKAAANALLKLLEEPRPGLIIILVSSKPGRLPPTIHSRVFTFRFSPPTWTDEVERFLKEKRADIDLRTLRTWFQILNGGIGTLLQFPIAEWEELRALLSQVLILGERGQIESLVEKLAARKGEASLIFDLIASLLLDQGLSEEVRTKMEVLTEARRGYREVLHADLFWEDFCYQFLPNNSLESRK